MSCLTAACEEVQLYHGVRCEQAEADCLTPLGLLPGGAVCHSGRAAFHGANGPALLGCGGAGVCCRGKCWVNLLFPVVHFVSQEAHIWGGVA